MVDREREMEDEGAPPPPEPMPSPSQEPSEPQQPTHDQPAKKISIVPKSSPVVRTRKHIRQFRKH